MQLTKDVRRQLLEQNDGFTTKSSYTGKNCSEDRTYAIRDGELHIRSNSNTSWADSRQRSEYVADEEQTHRFLYNHLGLLNQDGVVKGASQPKAKPVADTSDGDAQGRYDADDDGETKIEGGFGPGLLIAAVIAVAALGITVAGVAVWKKTAKPALERRRAARAEQKAADEPAQVEAAETPKAVPGDED